ncbi:unnamed protein product [Hydatigera taeniaeformis]|uniref:protein-serine/threonine phosphatase n=1 Tax=Hydatigena taeniaeformis TaxID=6205 RepID=A0A0R3WIA6_HYDTA|nr:unnamed protein product [Hydatigera taeniaeformis]
MGAYLSKPETAKETSSDSNEWISYGCSSMQGWRRFQEDAHNCILEFDPKKTAAFFAVYDGHGGSEVAKYCSLHLPDFILSQPRYAAEDGPIDPVSILKKAFIDFDVSLTRAKVKSELKEIASPEADADTVELSPHNSDAEENEVNEDGKKNKRKGRVKEAKKSVDGDDDLAPLSHTEEGVEEISELHEEAARPIEAVLRKQFRGELPDFIQTLLASICSKPGDADTSGPSTSVNTSDDLATDSKASPNTKAKDEEIKLSLRATTSEEGSTAPLGEKEKCEEEEVKEAGERDAPNLSATVSENVVNEEGDEDDEDDEDFEVGDEDEEEDDEEGEEVDYGEYDEEDDGDDEDEDEDEEEEEEEDEEGNLIGVLPRPVGFTEPGVDSGSTACVALVLPELGDQTDEEQQPRVCLYVANAGDSRAVLCRAGAAVDLSEDHKPEDPSEKARIQAAGGTVTADGRVNDGLNLSRAIGDHIYKCRTDLKMSEQMISALPDVSRTELIPGADEFVVIACDGIWNAMNSQAVVDFVYDRLHPEFASVLPTSNGDSETATAITTEKAENEERTAPIDRSSPAFLAKICEELFDTCLASNTMGDGTGCDNMTCIILRFDNLSELAKRATTRTRVTLDATEDESESEEVENIEVREAVESIEEGAEKEEGRSEELKSGSTQSSPIPVVNGSGGSGDGVYCVPSATPPSPALSPVPKKARIETSPQNGDGGGETLSSAE